MDVFVTLRRVPFVRFVIPLIAGIITGLQVSFPVKVSLALAVLGFVLLLFYHAYLPLKRSYKFRWLPGCILFVIFFFIGTSWVTLRQNKMLLHYSSQSHYYTGTIINTPDTSNNSIKTIVRVSKMQVDPGWKNLRGKALMYFEKSPESKRLQYGDKVVFKSRPEKITNNGNPYEFDYKGYLARKNIYVRGYISKSDWKRISRNTGNFLVKKSVELRNTLLAFYREHNITGKNYEVAAALTLGYKDELKDKTRRMYASSGAMHILAVSGLHVGVIYIILSSALGFLRNSRYTKFLFPIIIILALWGFALLTGLPPSVKRAATMFTFVTIGRSLNRPTHIYNTIAASAFFLLLITPFSITKVGFQLSYLAVLAIIYFQPKIYQVFYIKNPFLDKIWALTAVSIAAQIGTAPIAIFYFHKFPNYFLLTNILVIPLATVIIYLAVAAFIFAFLPVIASGIVWLLKYALSALNASVAFIYSLPHAASRDLFLSQEGVFILYGAIILIGIYIIRKHSVYLRLAMILLFALFSLKTVRNVSIYNEKEAYIYNSFKGNIAHLRNGPKSIIIADSSLAASPREMNFSVKNHVIRLGVNKTGFMSFMDFNEQIDIRNFYAGKNCFSFGDKSFLCVKKDFSLPDRQSVHIKTDYLWFHELPDNSLQHIFKIIHPRRVILGSTLGFYERQQIKEYLSRYRIPIHDLQNDGALIIPVI